MKIAKAALLVVAILWGSSFAFQKGLLESIDPVVFTLYNFLVAGVIFLAYAIYKKQDIFYRIREGIILGVLIAAMEISQMIGLHLSTAANTSFISNLGMLLIPYLGWLLYKHRVTAFNSALLLIAAFGMYFLVGGIDGFRFGDLVLLFSAGCMGFYFLFSERFEGEKGSHMATLCAQQFVFVSIVCLIIASVAHLPFDVPEGARFDLAWQIFVFTVIPYTLIQWASKYSDEMVVAMYDGVVEPLVGGLVAWGLFLEATSIGKVFGGMMMVFAFGVSVIYTNSHILLKKWRHKPIHI